MKARTRAEIRGYMAGGLYKMNAPYAHAYAFTLDDCGDLYSGEYMSAGDVIDFDRWSGYCTLAPRARVPTVTTLKPGQSVRVVRGGVERIKTRKEK